MLLIALLAGCKDQSLVDENHRLQQQVDDLKRVNERLERDNEALKAHEKRAQEDAEAAARTQALASIGYAPDKDIVATFVTSMGDIPCVLRPEQAPNTVVNFVQLARGEKEWTDPRNGEKSHAPLYDGTIFHRVIPEFMIQGGDPLGRGTGGPGYEFADEVGSFTVFDHPGILAMANAGPDTNGSQFFITEGTPTHLNGKHSIFGDCEGLDVVKKIARVDRDEQDKPKEDVVLKTVKFSVRPKATKTADSK
jgi:peptidyl-prolyl cis-trans isomerase A (cyclophilin A)